MLTRASLIGFVLAVLALVGTASANITISATATSEYTPQELLALATPGKTADLQNGSFLILKNPGVPDDGITGDGWDETTTWTLDFTSDPNYAAFVAAVGNGEALSAATYDLTITTWYAPGPLTDVTRPYDLFPQFILNDGSVTTTAGIPASVSFNLLNNYSSATLLNYFTLKGGTLPMLYADDAVVNNAVITLTIAPEPGTLCLLLPLGACMARGRRRGKLN